MSKKQIRINAIATSKARIMKKLEDMPNDQRAERWRSRINEYDSEMKILSLEVQIEEIKGTVIGIPTGSLKMEGQ